MTKKNKTRLAKIAAMFTHSTSLLHRISPPASFYAKTGYVFSCCSSFRVLIFTFSMLAGMTYLFHVIKNNGNNVRCTTEGEKSHKCVRNHAILIVPFRGTAKEYLFCNYQSLHS